MFNPLIIKEIRKELDITQADLYEGILSRSSYNKLEQDKRDLSLKQLSAICERLGMRPSEFLYRTDVTRIDSLPYWEKKIQLPEFTKNRHEFDTKLSELKSQRFDNPASYSLYLALLVLGIITNNISDYTPSKKHMKSLTKMYKKRETFFAVDYEIISNLAFFVPHINIDFLTNNLFPVAETHGDVFDISVQSALKNLISVNIDCNDFEKCEIYLDYFEQLRNIKGFNISTSINLEVVYLEYIKNFRKDRDINDFLEASKIVNLFLKLGYKETHSLLVDEISRIAVNENFQVPKEIAVYTQAYSNK